MILNKPSVLKDLIALAFLLSCFSSPIYGDFVTLGNGAGSKWGNRVHGTPSDTITWSFMSDGTTLAAGHPLIADGATGASNISSLRTLFDGANGGGNAFNQAIQNAFNTWATAAAGRITFQQVADNGAPSGGSSAASSAIDIRIGAFHSGAGTNFSFVGAVGYGPPGDDLNFPDALAGDVLINLDSQFFRAPGNEGDTFYTGGVYKNDLEGLVLHELGHAAIGLGHSIDGTFPGYGDVMYSAFNYATFVNRQLSSQDIAGLQSVYGITAVPEPSSLLLISIVTVCLASGLVRKNMT